MDVCRLLVEDPELSECLGPEAREQATAELIATVLRVPPGSWRPPPPPDHCTLGLLVLEGMLMRHVDIGGRLGLELLGETDLLRPWQPSDPTTLPLRCDWTVLSSARLAWLDGRLAHQLARHPELMARLLERALRRSRQLTANMAIVHQPRVDTRLALLLWQLAARWGRVRRDGVLVPLRLTHALLADLVAARRPTVTSALSDLARRGVLRQVEEGWLLLGQPPAIGEREPHTATARQQDAFAGIVRS